MADIAKMPTQVVGDHLTAIEAANYATQNATPAEQERIETHYESCDACCERLEMVFDGLREWDERDKLALKYFPQDEAPPHLNPFAAVSIASDSQLYTEAHQDHLRECSACSTALLQLKEELLARQSPKE